jgi:hypothetical protein
VIGKKTKSTDLSHLELDIDVQLHKFPVSQTAFFELAAVVNHRGVPTAMSWKYEGVNLRVKTRTVFATGSGCCGRKVERVEFAG